MFSFEPDNHPELFPYVLLMVSLNALMASLIPMFYTGSIRGRVFTKEYMSRFTEEHQAAFGQGTQPGSMGFPDTGNGRYSQQLSYADWLLFNNAQRVHYNYLETLPYVLTLMVIAGLKQPLAALILSIAHFVFRLVYTLGYAGIGPNARGPGAMLNFFVTLTLMGLSIYTCAEFMKCYNVTIETHIIIE